MKLPQLSLRELFLLVLVAAILCGWLVSELRWRNFATMADRRHRYLDMLSMHLEQALYINGHTVQRQGDGRSEFAVPLVDGKEVDGLGQPPQRSANRKLTHYLPPKEGTVSEYARSITLAALVRCR